MKKSQIEELKQEIGPAPHFLPEVVQLVYWKALWKPCELLSLEFRKKCLTKITTAWKT